MLRQDFLSKMLRKSVRVQSRKAAGHGDADAAAANPHAVKMKTDAELARQERAAAAERAAKEGAPVTAADSWVKEGAWAKLRDGRVGKVITAPSTYTWNKGEVQLQWGEYGTVSNGLQSHELVPATEAEGAPTELAFQQRRWATADPQALWAGIEQRGGDSAVLQEIWEQCTYGGSCLDFNTQCISEKEASALCAALEALPPTAAGAIKTVRLYGCGLLDALADPLARGLRNCQQLEVLRVSANRGLGDYGVATFAAVLPPTMKEFDINRTGCGDEGVQAAVAALGPALEVFNCIGCNVGKAGFTALAEGLQRWGGLQKLLCAYNPGPSKVLGEALVAQLPALPCLKELEIQVIDI